MYDDLGLHHGQRLTNSQHTRDGHLKKLSIDDETMKWGFLGK